MPTLSRSKTPTVKLKLGLHLGQREVYDSPARFKVVACGRQWGKSRLGSAIAFERALKSQAVWWVAPDANVAAIGWKLLKSLARQVPTIEIRESERILYFPGGGWIQVKGAHNEGKLRGVTLDYLIIDEAAFIPSADRWNSELRPTLAVRHGGALFISTFDGENWFYDLYQRGQDEGGEWESWRKPSTENPYFSVEELEEARRTTPEAEFEQEYLANPLVYVGAVFAGEKIQEALDGGAELKHKPALPVLAGLDWGYTNATAFEVCQETAEGAIEWIDEQLWVATELNKRCQAIADMCERYGVQLIAADSAGATEIRTLAETLKSRGLRTRVQPVSFSKYKEAAISTRRYYLERGMERLGPKCTKLARDTKRYRYKEGEDKVVKSEDHTVDASLALYATRARRLVKAA